MGAQLDAFARLEATMAVEGGSPSQRAAAMVIATASRKALP